MTTTTEDRRHTALAVASRRRLLEILRSAEQPVDAAALAMSIGVHVTTVRFHLDVLEDAGLVQRRPERAGRPGRPRQLYRAIPAGDGNRQLVEVLAGALAAEPGAADFAERAGRRWADHEVAEGAGSSTWEEATGRLGQLFDRLGFAPVLVDQPDRRRWELHACPFRALAESHPQVVCTVHLGLMRGALERLHVDQTPSLQPFVTPDLCVAEVPRPLTGQASR